MIRATELLLINPNLILPSSGWYVRETPLGGFGKVEPQESYTEYDKGKYWETHFEVLVRTQDPH